jgi:hypothetical protein
VYRSDTRCNRHYHAGKLVDKCINAGSLFQAAIVSSWRSWSRLISDSNRGSGPNCTSSMEIF